MKKILRKIEKDYEIPKKNWWKVERIAEKFYIKFGESLYTFCGISKLISKTFKSKNLRIIKCRPSRNHQDQYSEKILRKTWKNFTKSFKYSHKNLDEICSNLHSHN